MSNQLLRWILALLNALGVVGVGTFLAGRKKTGLIQILISLGSFILTVVPLFFFYRSSVREGEGLIAWYLALLRGERWESDSLIWLGWACLGTVTFILNWLWGWTTTSPTTRTPPPLPGKPEK